MTENEFWGRDMANAVMVAQGPTVHDGPDGCWVDYSTVRIIAPFSAAQAVKRARNPNDPSWLAHERMREEMSNG